MTEALKTRSVPGHTLVKIYDDVTGRWWAAWVPHEPPQTLWQLIRYWFTNPFTSESEEDLDRQLERRARRLWRKYMKQQVKAARRIARDKSREEAAN
jgi:Fe-S cluster biosynthesis and repair protein YggX